MNRLILPALRRSFHCGTFKMSAFIERQQQAERTIDLLRQQIAALITIAEQKQKLEEQKEIEKLQKENQEAERTVRQLRGELRFYESQNGVKHVLVPIKSSTQQVATSTTTAPTENKKQQPQKDGNDSQQKKKEKKENNNKGKANKENKAPKNAEPAAPVDVSRLNLKIGKIVKVQKHPDADGLFMETVDLGEEKPRTILSGLVKHYTLDQMQDRLAIFLCNLKPAKMRGITSEGMIMCASTPEKVEIITPPEGASIGDCVYCPQFKGQPDPQLNPKRKIWEQVAPDLKIDADGFATYQGQHLIIDGKGKCKAPTMTGCLIK